MHSAGSVPHLREWIDKYHNAAKSAGVVVSDYSCSSPLHTMLILGTDHQFLRQFQRSTGPPHVGVCPRASKQVLPKDEGASFVTGEHVIGPERRDCRVDDGAIRFQR